MLKLMTSVPVVALALILLLRGMGAPSPSHSQSSPSTKETQETPAVTPHLALARSAFEDGTKAISQARAFQIYSTAQRQKQPLQWVDSYCRKVAGDVAYLRKRYGTITGEAAQFGEFLNRTTEMAACALSQDWMLNGGIDPTAASPVSPALILQRYQEAYGK